MQGLGERIHYASTTIQKQTNIIPQIAIILGTGMGGLISRVQEAMAIPYSRIPGFPSSNTEDERERLILGNLAQQPVLIMPKRFHYYEGFSFQQIAFPIRVMKTLGINIMIICNCAGGLNPLFKPGDLMVITDHINLMCSSPLIGPNIDQFGPRFPDMKNAYDPCLVSLAESIALEEKLHLNKGIYIAVHGPNLETPAETRFLRSTGADAVGMSTVPEVIVAMHAGMQTLGFSIISNVNLPDAFQPIDYQEILSVAARAESKLIRLIERIVEQINIKPSKGD